MVLFNPHFMHDFYEPHYHIELWGYGDEKETLALE